MEHEVFFRVLVRLILPWGGFKADESFNQRISKKEPRDQVDYLLRPLAKKRSRIIAVLVARDFSDRAVKPNHRCVQTVDQLSLIATKSISVSERKFWRIKTSPHRHTWFILARRSHLPLFTYVYRPLTFPPNVPRKSNSSKLRWERFVQTNSTNLNVGPNKSANESNIFYQRTR